MKCNEFEGSLAAVADGGAPPEEAARVARHVASCAACRQALEEQTAVRAVLRARAPQLAVTAPPGLRTRIAANVRAERAGSDILSWGGRLSAFSAAAILVLVVGAALLPVVTARSTVVLAAQLALDHLKCFSIDGHSDGHAMSEAEAEAAIKRDHGWTIAVPASAPVEGLALVAVRRCLFGDGFAAHIMYRINGESVSLFVMPDLARPAAELGVLGHDAIVWTKGDYTYMLVAGDAARAQLARVASYLQNEAK